MPVDTKIWRKDAAPPYRNITIDPATILDPRFGSDPLPLTGADCQMHITTCGDAIVQLQIARSGNVDARAQADPDSLAIGEAAPVRKLDALPSQGPGNAYD